LPHPLASQKIRGYPLREYIVYCELLS